MFIQSQWQDFFLMLGGGCASLTGLVFVGMSINLKVVAKDATHKNRAIGTLTGFTAVFLMCAFALIGDQNHLSIGIEWLAVSIPATYIYINGYIKAVKKGRSELGLSLTRAICGSLCYVAQIVGSIIFILGYVLGLYIAAIAIVISLTFFISAAWLLIMGIHESQTKS